MARKPKAIVLDSWAVLAYLEDEKSGQAVAEFLSEEIGRASWRERV